MRSLRIAVADDEPVVRDYFCRILPLLGHEVVAVAANGTNWSRAAANNGPT